MYGGFLIPISVFVARGASLTFWSVGGGVWQECRWVKYCSKAGLEYAGGGTPGMLGQERLISIKNLAFGVNNLSLSI